MSVKKIIVFVSLLVAFVAVVWAFVFGNQKKSGVCESLVVEVARDSEFAIIDDKTITAIVNNNGLNPIGKPIDKIRIDRIRQVVESNPCVEWAKCYLTKSGNLHIEAKEREPIFRIMGQQNYFVDKTGEKVAYNAPIPVFMPIVSGFLNRDTVGRELIDFVEFIKSDEFLSDLIQQIYIGENRSVELIPTVGNHKILMGRLYVENESYLFGKQMDRLKQFYESKVLDRLGWDNYSAIDLRFDKQIVLKKR